MSLLAAIVRCRNFPDDRRTLIREVRPIKDLLGRLATTARASPGELALVAILGVAMVSGAALVYVRTDRSDLPPIREVASAHIEEVKAVEKVVVHVAGLVASPGVYELPSGSRVADALAAAGGAAEGADLNSLNLAEVLSDGQKVLVGKVGEVAGAQVNGGPTASQKINLNTATAQTLEQLPGVGPVLAQRIIEYRTKKRFTSTRQLMEVEGFGPKKYESLKSLITV